MSKREPAALIARLRLPEAWTEVRYCVYSYRSEPEWWEMVAHYPRLEQAQKHADAINGRESCAAAVGWQIVRYGSVRLLADSSPTQGESDG